VLRDKLHSPGPERAGTAPAGEPPPAQRPGRRGARRLLAEGLAAYAAYQLLTIWFLKALRSSLETFYGDVLIGFFGPEKHGAAQFVRHGFLPTWVREQFAGEPYLANLQHAVLYPGNLPFWLFKTSVGLEIVAATHVAFAAVAMWAYCRLALRVSAPAALLGGLAFGFGGLALQHISLINQLEVIAWMPVVLLFGQLALERGGLRWVLLTAAAIGLQFLAGHPEEWVYTLIALALAGIVWTVAGGRAELARRALRAARRLGGAVALFVLLFGWQLFPTVQLQRLGWRGDPGFAEQYPLPAGVTLNALLPDYGRVLTGEFVSYVGVVALGLAALGIAAGRRDLRWQRVWMGLMALLGLLMAVGLRSPLYSLVYHHVDVIADFRVPTRWLLLTTFGLAGGAALGTDALLTRHVGDLKGRLRQGLAAAVALAVLVGCALTVGNMDLSRASAPWWLAAAAAGVAIWLAAAHPSVPRLAVAALLLVTTAVELRQARPYGDHQELAPAIVYDHTSAVLRRLGRDGGRYMTDAPLAASSPAEWELIRVPEGITGRAGAYYRAGYGRNLAARPGWEYAVHAQTPLGRDGGLMPLREYSDFLQQALGVRIVVRAGQALAPPSQFRFEALDFLGVRWFVTPGLPPGEVEALRRHGFEPVLREGHILLWQRPEPPVARVQYDLDVIGSRAERLRRLREGYPLTTRAMVSEPVAGVTGGPAPAPTVQAVHVGDTRVTLRVTSAREGLLVLADPWYPGWQARVNGDRTAVRRVDEAFRGVRVPAGTSEVVFTYRDAGMQLGALLAALTALGLAAWALIVRPRRGGRRRRSGPRSGPT